MWMLDVWRINNYWIFHIIPGNTISMNCTRFTMFACKLVVELEWSLGSSTACVLCR
jgi:hypothetical protein